MPKIFEYFGMIFYFYSNEHLPVHVHVKYGQYESIYEIYMEEGKLKTLKKRKKRGVEHLPSVQAKETEKFITHYVGDITKLWFEYFVLKNTVKCKKISKKL
jgi:hypothetical protein